MTADGVAAIHARISSIQARIATFSATTPTRAPGLAPGGVLGAAPDDFAVALADALDRPGSGGPAVVQAPGAYGALTPPPELAAYGNGQIPVVALASIGGNHHLHRPAAEAFTSLRAAAAAEGVTIGVTDSYRSHAAQVDLAERKGLHKHGGLAAVPGTSNHGWGMSLDLDLDDRAQTWMHTNAARFGFVEDVPREPWHWTYRPG